MSNALDFEDKQGIQIIVLELLLCYVMLWLGVICLSVFCSLYVSTIGAAPRQAFVSFGVEQTERLSVLFSSSMRANSFRLARIVL